MSSKGCLVPVSSSRGTDDLIKCNCYTGLISQMMGACRLPRYWNGFTHVTPIL